MGRRATAADDEQERACVAGDVASVAGQVAFVGDVVSLLTGMIALLGRVVSLLTSMIALLRGAVSRFCFRSAPPASAASDRSLLTTLRPS